MMKLTKVPVPAAIVNHDSICFIRHSAKTKENRRYSQTNFSAGTLKVVCVSRSLKRNATPQAVTKL